jgi:hypothetical protein
MPRFLERLVLERKGWQTELPTDTSALFQNMMPLQKEKK